jgi:hypothetical protein
MKTPKQTYTIQQFDPKQGGWTSEGIGESQGWPSKRLAQQAIASLRRLGPEWRTTKYRIVRD